MVVKGLSILCLLAACVADANVATAREGQGLSYTIEDVRACSRDALRLCRDKLGDNEAIEACMRTRFAELSPACQARFNR